MRSYFLQGNEKEFGSLQGHRISGLEDVEGRFGMRDQLSNLKSFPDSHGDSVAQGARRNQTGCGSTVRCRLTVLVWFIQQGFSRRNTERWQGPGN